MQKTIEERLKELRVEYHAGQQKLAELDAQRNAVRDTMLRISGAIQALEEMADSGPTRPGRDALEAVSAGVVDA